MYKINYDEYFFENMSNISTYIKDYFYKLYTDTGIIDDYLILDSYEKSVNLLQKNIFDEIEMYCKSGLLGRTIISKNDIQENGFFFIRINSYKIKIEFTLFIDDKNVLIKAVKINT